MNEPVVNSHENPSDEWLTKPQLAERYRCSLRSISNLMKRRIIPYYKVGKILRFKAAECDEALKEYRTESIFEYQRGRSFTSRKFR